jgi:hypothetical protein
VVYVDKNTIRGRNTEACIDFHLQVDVEECAARIITAMDQVQLTPISSVAFTYVYLAAP